MNKQVIYDEFRDELTKIHNSTKHISEINEKLTELAGEFTRQYPNMFSIVGCDDGMASNSIWLFIKPDDGYVVVFCVPQLELEPYGFFLFDDHRLRVLKKLVAKL